jgi:hypothetical protein
MLEGVQIHGGEVATDRLWAVHPTAEHRQQDHPADESERPAFLLCESQ